MGRKKIEIQPITHERNRSVTFLKRKNGLFKKAYELGVLCSVDVAVIIFEERPGHHVKLYQYCSADINDIVQRHLRHDGEKDHKGPADFSGNNNPKIDDIGDDDDGDEDDEVPSRSKRGRDGKLKPPPDMHVAGIDYSHRSLSIPQPPSLSMHGIGPQNAGPGLPISSDRLSNLRNSAKRGRLDIHPQSRSPSDDPSNATSYYHPHSSAASFAAARQSAGYPSSHHQGNPQYTPFFSPQSPPSFLQSGGAGHSSRPAPGYGISHHAGASGSTSYDSAPIYPNIMGRTGSTTLTSSTSAGSSGGSLFPPFIDTDEQGRHQQHSQAQQTGFGSLDWPVHNSGNSSSPAAHSSLPVPNPPPPSTDSGGQNSNSHWLDFLSTSNNAPSASTAREIMSWERGGGPPSNNSDLYVERGRPSTAGSPLIAGIVNATKRSPGGLLTSPLTGVNGRDDGNKELPPS